VITWGSVQWWAIISILITVQNLHFDARAGSSRHIHVKMFILVRAHSRPCSYSNMVHSLQVRPLPVHPGSSSWFAGFNVESGWARGEGCSVLGLYVGGGAG
jgi:hypothetical protein